MGRKQKETPYRCCAECDKQLERKRYPNGDLECLTNFNLRKFCDQRCMGLAFDKRHSHDVGWSAAHSVARSLVPLGLCNRCAKPSARDVHHMDGDHLNNLPTNLERICRSCHNLEHRRRGYCVICGKPHKGMGYCATHYQRFKKWGDPMSVKDNQFTPLRKESETNPPKACAVLMCTAKYHANGYCNKHSQQAARGTLGQPEVTRREAVIKAWATRRSK